MASTTYSPQYILNILYGSASPTQYSEQGICNLVMGNQRTSKSVQRILNENSGQTNGTTLSEQQALWTILQTPLSLTGSKTQYTVQALLNMAYEANLTIGQAIGASGYVPPVTSAGPLGPSLALSRIS